MAVGDCAYKTYVITSSCIHIQYVVTYLKVYMWIINRLWKSFNLKIVLEAITYTRVCELCCLGEVRMVRSCLLFLFRTYLGL